MNDKEKIKRVKEIFDDILYIYDDEPIDVLKFDIVEDNLLHIAAYRGNIEAAKLLVELGIDVNALGDMSYTALHYAAQQGHDEIYDYLISHGADPTILSEFKTTPIDEKKKRSQKINNI